MNRSTSSPGTASLVLISNSKLGTIDFTVSFSHASNNLARKTKIDMFACPSDIGLVENEWHSPTWARIRAIYVVNFGNTTYGQLQKAGIPFLGAPFVPVKKHQPSASLTA